ncbi:hypothetical protein [Pseudaminobacter salicylatoxidans]|uniref:hypothetical protein n=1 Tax=Pseudaminobacter salicylatoxidans TaxID=93369 RepID=UPI000314AA63|nr:hypothetical protein [Pseudaminobacter salicylatoxidans]
MFNILKAGISRLVIRVMNRSRMAYLGAAQGGRLSVAAPLAAALSTCVSVTGSDALAQSSGNSAAFSMPANIAAWRLDALRQNGVYRFGQVDGNCQITFGQNLGADAARAKGLNPRQSMGAYIDRVAAAVGRVERVEVDAVELKSSTGDGVLFASIEFAYMGKDKVEYQNRISAAWIGDVELLIVAACPAAEWFAGRPLIDAFVSKTSITQISDP